MNALTYAIYLTISVLITVCFGHSLHKNGRHFLVKCFDGNESLADAVNHLLLVGYYLVNIAFVALMLRFGDRASTLIDAVNFVSTNVGIVCLVLGSMHFGNLIVLTLVRTRQLTTLR